MKGNGRMGNGLGREPSLIEKGNGKETSMKENGRTGNGLDKEPTLGLMETSI